METSGPATVRIMEYIKDCPWCQKRYAKQKAVVDAFREAARRLRDAERKSRGALVMRA